MPAGWSDVEGAAAVSGLMTQHDALVRAAGLRSGESVVVHGAGAAVGLTAVQLARFLGARPIVATTRGDSRDDLVLAAGADHVLPTAAEPFSDRVLSLTDGAGADVIVDHVGGPYLEGSLRCLAIGGRLVSVGRLGGAVGPLDLEQLAYRRARIVGVTFRTRSLEQCAEIAQGVIGELLPAMERGRLRPFVDRTYPLHAAAEAHRRMAGNRQRGKLVLTVAGASAAPLT